MLKNKTKAYEKHLKALVEDLSEDEHEEDANEVLTSGLTDAFAKVQKQTQEKIGKCQEQIESVEKENSKFFEKMEREFQQHVEKIKAKDGFEKKSKEPVKVVTLDKEQTLASIEKSEVYGSKLGSAIACWPSEA